MKASLMIGGASKEHERSPMDFYNTPPEVTTALAEFLDLPKKMQIIEPACGQGAISEVFKARGHHVLSSDIRETGYGAGGIDFLPAKLDARGYAIITNPPFSHLPQFIRKCHETDADIFALLAKATFWHAKSRVELFDLIPPAFVLPLTWRPAFAPERGAAPTMDFSWLVWERGNRETKFVPLSRPGGAA